MGKFFEQAMKIPVLETERLILREFRMEDFSDLIEMSADPKVMKHIGGENLPTEEEVWMKFIRNPGHWLLFGFGNWIFADKMSGKYIGTGGLAYYRRILKPAMSEEEKAIPEIGYVLASHAHGKGYATEAVRAILAWADKNPATRKTIALINEGNEGSVRVVGKAGYKEHRRVIYKEKPCVLYMR